MHYGISRTFEDFIFSFFSVPSFISREIHQTLKWYDWKDNEMKFTEKKMKILKKIYLVIKF